MADFEIKDGVGIIPEGTTKIGNYAFSDCTGLTSVTIPDSVTKIGVRAFYGCIGLTSVTIGNSVTEIGDEAFKGCTGLTSITIPDSVTEIRSSAFDDCTSLIKAVEEAYKGIDWEQRRFELVNAALTGVLAGPSSNANLLNDALKNQIVNHAAGIADRMISRLKRDLFEAYLRKPKDN